jgi:hypothetical protein
MSYAYPYPDQVPEDDSYKEIKLNEEEQCHMCGKKFTITSFDEYEMISLGNMHYKVISFCSGDCQSTYYGVFTVGRPLKKTK